MAAYLIVDVKVNNQEKFKQYATMVQSTVKKFSGQYLCKWGIPETLEGSRNSDRIVIVQFENAEKAKKWWNSEEYRPLKALRRESSDAKVILVDEI